MTVYIHLSITARCLVFIFTLFHVQILSPQGDCRFLVGPPVVLLSSEKLKLKTLKFACPSMIHFIHSSKAERGLLGPNPDYLYCIFFPQVSISDHKTIWNILSWSKTRQACESLLLSSLCSFWVWKLTYVKCDQGSHPPSLGTDYTLSWHPCCGKNKAIYWYRQVGQFHH